MQIFDWIGVDSLHVDLEVFDHNASETQYHQKQYQIKLVLSICHASQARHSPFMY